MRMVMGVVNVEMTDGSENGRMIILLWETGIRIWKSCRMALQESRRR